MKTPFTAETVSTSIDSHRWTYGNTEVWADYTRVLEGRLHRAGIPAYRYKMRYADNPLTDKWAIEFPKMQLNLATIIADAINHRAWKTGYVEVQDEQINEQPKAA
jgi:hypothetical protein